MYGKRVQVQRGVMDARKQWDRVGMRHHHGIAVPLFSIWTEKSSGIGEYLDLLPLIDWCSEVGLDVIQLLPLNDTGSKKSPYSAISAFDLNPIHVSLPHPKPLKHHRVDYAAVRKHKAEFLKSVDVQALCFEQMETVKKHAEKKGVLIKGDIPILSKGPHDLFLPHLQAGAPPDAYAKEGQNWGFPIYDWENKYDEIMAWWKKRLQVASKIYHMYRLDHVVGLFRIFAIPKGKKAKDGFFLPEDESQWLPQGTQILKTFLKECPMLPIAEDLGTVPESVKGRLVELGIPGTKVLRWEKGPIAEYPEMSMTTVSTHDTETLKAWWESEHPGKQLDEETRLKILRSSHQSPSLFHINQFYEYFPASLRFENEEDARVNDPADPKRPLNWSVRFKAPLEEILSNEALRQMVKNAIQR